jgi:hypothetical protein
MRAAVVFGVLAVALACDACAGERSPPTKAPPSPSSPSPPSPPTEADVIAKSLPGVVLILNHRADGAVGFGAGIVVDDAGRILTNLHVVANARSLGVMFYDRSRVSYIPQDGGLGRYLFENEKDVQHATLVRGEPVLDLAIVKVDVDTSRLVRLPFRADPPRVGERVMALGHPSETVWSFSSGLVSAMHSGVLQTDAAINHGNSGGPLIDVYGRVVGVNTSRLFGDSQGIAFARPIALAKELIDGTRGPTEMDLSTPEKAFTSCKRAWEMGSAEVADCLDEESLLRSMKETQARVAQSGLVPPEAIAKMQTVDRIDPAKWVAFRKHALVMSAKGASREERLRESMTDLGGMVSDASGSPRSKAQIEKLTSKEELDKVLHEGAPYVAVIDKDRETRTGMKLDSLNPESGRELRKMGLRIDRVEIVGDRAWILVRGRNVDATPYAYAELWWRRKERWLPATIPFADDMATLPSGFPRTVDNFEAMMDRTLAVLAKTAKSTRAPQAAKPADDPKKETVLKEAPKPVPKRKPKDRSTAGATH